MIKIFSRHLENYSGKKKEKKLKIQWHVILQIKLPTDLNLLVNLFLIFNLWPDERFFCLPPPFLLLPVFFSTTNSTTSPTNFITNQPLTTNPANPTFSLSAFLFWFKLYWGFPTSNKQNYSFFLWTKF
jgi:hypothetical protein